MLDFATALRSAPFKVLLGKDRICFTIPKSLPKNLSPPLYNLMNNEHMKEAQEGLAILEDVEDDIFVGFCEFAYTGDYRSRMMERRAEIENNIGVPAEEQEASHETRVEWEAPTEVVLVEEAPAVEEPVDYWGLGRRGQTKNVPKAKAEQLWSDFKSLEFEDKHPHTSDERVAVANGDLSSTSLTTESLLYHAKIYLFAEKYLIDDLRILSLRKLHASLRDFDLTLQTNEDILDLLEFAYMYTARQESSENELRALIVHYAACKAEILKQNVNLRSLLNANGEMGCDLFYKI